MSTPELHDGELSVLSLSVCVVTVTYGNRYHLLEQVLESLVDHNEYISSVIVVDNGSYDNIGANVASNPRFHNVFVYKLPENQGSAGGFAAGLAAASAKNTDLIWLLDDDNRPQPYALQKLLNAREVLGNLPNILLLSYRADRYQYMQAANLGDRRILKPNQFQGISGYGLCQKLFSSSLAGPTEPVANYPLIRISLAPYGGLLLSTAWVKRVGLPNKEFFTYSDDYDYSTRITENGGSIYLCTTSKIDDIDVSWYARAPGARSMFDVASSASRVYYSVRNQTVIERKLATSLPIYFLNIFVALFVLCIWSLFRGNSFVWVFERLKLVLFSFLDGWSGQLGRRDLL